MVLLYIKKTYEKVKNIMESLDEIGVNNFNDFVNFFSAQDPVILTTLVNNFVTK